MNAHTRSTLRAATRATALTVLLLGAGAEATAAPAPFVATLEDGQIHTRAPGEPAHATGLR
ncbi:MAG: hypothetical protein EP329_16835, partial [Deltaproteobacteria bacterium]